VSRIYLTLRPITLRFQQIEADFASVNLGLE
jgi:hypothetical protein